MIDPLYRSDSIFHALFTRARLDQKWSTSVISGLELPNPGFFFFQSRQTETLQLLRLKRNMCISILLVGVKSPIMVVTPLKIISNISSFV